MSTHALINGNYVTAEDASILISDLSVQRGYGIFDYFRTIGGKPVFLADHLDRFYRSAEFMHLPVPAARARLQQLIEDLIAKNNIPDSGIRITLTGGYSENGYTPADPNLLITQTPFAFSEAGFEKGIQLITHDFQRQLPQVKTIDYLQAIYLQPYIKAQQADDVLYHHQGSIRECPRANFFIVTATGEVVTPAEHILQGITRKKILTFSDFRIKATDVHLSDVRNAREAFISSSTKEVLPVLKIDGEPVGDGRPGKLTRQIYDRLMAMKRGG